MISWAVQSVMCLRENIPCVHRVYFAVVLQNELCFKELFAMRISAPSNARKQPPVITSLTGRRK